MRPTSVWTVPDAAALAETALFNGLTNEQLETIRPHMHRKTFPAGTNVVTAEQPGEVLFVILSGTVKVQVDQLDGSEVILAVLGAGQSIGEMSVTDKLGRSASVITLDESTLAWIDRSTFAGYQQLMPRLVHNVAAILSNRLRVANAQIQALATQDVYGRVARQLLSLADAYGKDDGRGDIHIPMRLTQGDFASLVGASRVRVNQALVQFKDQGYISVDAGHRITVHNEAALAARCP
jgi:CRP/FNR family transcriptional regulator, cyclic AMP receptor protein